MKRKRENKGRKIRRAMVGAKEQRVKFNINRDCAAVILVANITKPQQDVCSCPNREEIPRNMMDTNVDLMIERENESMQ